MIQFLKILFFALKMLAWACFLILILYLILTALFFFFNSRHFLNFQHNIFATPIIYIVPTVLIASLIAGHLEDLGEDQVE
jgi:hypothetical protein